MSDIDTDVVMAAEGAPPVPPGRSVQDTVVRNSALLGVVFVFNLFAGLITSSLLTRLLGRDLYGIYGNYFRLYSWLGTIAAFIVPPVIVRYVAELLGAGREGHAWRLLRVSLLIQIVMIIAICTSYGLYTWMLESSLRAEPLMVTAIFIAVAAQVLAQLWDNFLRGFQDFRASAIANFAAAVARLVGYSALFIAAVASVTATMFVFAGSNVVLALVLFIAVRMLRRKRPVTTDTTRGAADLRKRIIEYASMMGVGGLLSMVIWNNIETFMIASWWKGNPGREAELAFYTLAITLSSLPTRVGKMMAQALLPAFSEFYGSGEIDRLRRGFFQATIMSTIIGAYLCCVSAACAMPFVRLLFPDEMLGAVVPFQLMLIPVLLMSVNYAASAALFAFEWQRYFLASTIVLVPINLALDWWLVPKHGAIGAGMVNAIVQTAAIMTGLYYICIIRRLGFPTRKAAGAVVAALAAGGVAYAITIGAGRAHIHDLPTLAACGLASMIVYLGLLRVFRIIDDDERKAFIRCERLLPNRARPLYRWAVALAAGR